MPGVYRYRSPHIPITTLFWRLVGPLVVLVTILTLPVSDAVAFGALEAGAAAPVVTAQPRPPVLPAAPALYQRHDAGEVPVLCTTSCGPSDPGAHHAPQARYESPAGRAGVVGAPAGVHLLPAASAIAQAAPTLRPAPSPPPAPPPQATI